MQSTNKIQTNCWKSAHNELWVDINVLAQTVVVAIKAVFTYLFIIPTITANWFLHCHVPMPPPLVGSPDNHSLDYHSDFSSCPSNLTECPYNYWYVCEGVLDTLKIKISSYILRIQYLLVCSCYYSWSNLTSWRSAARPDKSSSKNQTFQQWYSLL